MIVVGSKALEHFGLNRGVPKDIDRWYTAGETAPDSGDNVLMPKNIHDNVETVDDYATPDSVYTIKCSHLAWDIKWEKTKKDILWLKALGCKIIPELFRLLRKHWEIEHGDKSFLSLNKGKGDFFDDHVVYEYDHDYLHELVSYPETPMYLNVLKSGSDVLTDKVKFDKLDFQSQIRLFREEITVIACERWLINKYWSGKVGWYKAYGMALKKTIISLTKGWACEFIIKNLDEFTKPDYNYFKHILNRLEIKMTVDTKEIEFLLKKLSEDNELTDESIVALADGEFDEIEFGVGYNDFDDWSAYHNHKEKKLSDLGYEHIMQEGGGEGGAEDCEGVFKLNDRYYKVHWGYRSYHGTIDDDALETLTEVFPKEKTVVVYE